MAKANHLLKNVSNKDMVFFYCLFIVIYVKHFSVHDAVLMQSVLKYKGHRLADKMTDRRSNKKTQSKTVI